MAIQNEERQSYSFKASPWSSHSQILAVLPERGEGRRALDVGCWDGLLAARLAERGYQVTGIERQRWDAGEFPSTVKLVVADLHSGVPEIKDRFDIILCADVLEHLLSPERVLRELGDLLAPGGVLIASLPNSGNWYFRLVVLLGRFPKEEKGLFDRTHLHFHPWSGWRDLLEATGYTIEKVSPTPVPFTVVAGAENPLARWAERIYCRAARFWKSLLAYQFLVQARRRT